jgi:hypothetical protein
LTAVGLLRYTGLVPEDEDAEAEKMEEAEREKNRQLRKQQSLIVRARKEEAEARKAARGGASSDESDIGSDVRFILRFVAALRVDWVSFTFGVV